MEQIDVTEIIDALAFTVAQGYDEDTVLNVIEELGIDNFMGRYYNKLKSYREDIDEATNANKN